MAIEITEDRPPDLIAYGAVSIAFEVRGVFDVDEQIPVAGSAPAAARLTYRALARPYVKDYDAPPGLAPHNWSARFDVSTWGVLSAWVGGRRVGGAVVVPTVAAVLEVRGFDAAAVASAAVLWDLRVAPAWRQGRGVGAALFRAASDWACARGAATLLVETQTSNVPACRFYARHGCVVAAVRRAVYPAPLAADVQLIWRTALTGANIAT